MTWAPSGDVLESLFLLNNQFHTKLISGSKDPFKFPYNDYKQYLFFYVAVAVYIVWY